MVAAVVGLIASILGLAAKSKGAMVLAVIALIAGAAGVYLAVSKNASNMVLAGSAATAVTSLILAVLASKNKGAVPAKTEAAE
jgi:multisubunit Na+/H+ antiporter MnhC subunit